MSDKPNIVFFFTDDQRFDTIHALGNAEIKTPFMDALVKNGVSFTQAHIPGGTDAAVCMPSRAMLHTGRTLFHLQGAGEQIPEEHVTLGEWLQQNGYYTWGTGKWHNGTNSFNRSFCNGAEIFFGGMTDHWNVPAFNYDPTGRYDSVLLQCVDPLLSNQTIERKADHIHSGKHSSEVISNASIKFIKNYKKVRPFFMYISTLAPHDPRTMPKEFLEMYSPDLIKLPENFRENHPFDNGDLKSRDELLAPFPRTMENIKRHISEYYSMITHLDYNLGKVYYALEEKGILDNTIIILAGDNGLALGQHGLLGKQNCYEHSTRVPLVFSGPGIPHDIQRDHYVYLFDIFPTICELVELEIPPTVEGKSLVESMKNPTHQIRDSLYLVYREFQRAIKYNNFKLIEYCVKKNRNTQLFDLQQDPHEMNNLAQEPKFKADIESLRLKMKYFRDDWNDITSKWGRRFWKKMEKF